MKLTTMKIPQELKDEIRSIQKDREGLYRTIRKLLEKNKGRLL